MSCSNKATPDAPRPEATTFQRPTPYLPLPQIHVSWRMIPPNAPKTVFISPSPTQAPSLFPHRPNMLRGRGDSSQGFVQICQVFGPFGFVLKFPLPRQQITDRRVASWATHSGPRVRHGGEVGGLQGNPEEVGSLCASTLQWQLQITLFSHVGFLFKEGHVPTKTPTFLCISMRGVK